MSQFAKKQVFTQGRSDAPVIKQDDLKPHTTKNLPQVQTVFAINLGTTEPLAIRKAGTVAKYNVNDKVDVYNTRTRTVKLTNIIRNEDVCWVYTGDTTDTARKVSCSKIRHPGTKKTCDNYECLPESTKVWYDYLEEEEGCIYLRVDPLFGKTRWDKSEIDMEMVNEGLWERGEVKKDSGGAQVKKVKLDSGTELTNVDRKFVLPMDPVSMQLQPALRILCMGARDRNLQIFVGNTVCNRSGNA